MKMIKGEWFAKPLRIPSATASSRYLDLRSFDPPLRLLVHLKAILLLTYILHDGESFFQRGRYNLFYTYQAEWDGSPKNLNG